MIESSFLEALNTMVEQFESSNQEQQTFENINLIDTYKGEELGNIISEFFEYLYNKYNISQIEFKFRIKNKIDDTSLLNMLVILRSYNYENLRFEETGRILEPEMELDHLEAEIDSIITSSSLPLFYFPFETTIEEILLCRTEANEALDQNLYELVLYKLTLFPDSFIKDKWFRVKNMIKRKRFNKSDKYFEEYPEDFFKNDISIEEIKENYALFLVKLLPGFIKKLITSGEKGYPMIDVGIFTILASSKNLSEPVSQLEASIMRCFSMIAAAYETSTPHKAEELRKSLQMAENNYIFKSEEFGSYTKSFTKAQLSIKNIHQILIRLTKYIKIYKDLNTNIDNVLLRYKLGQEVLGEDHHKFISTKNEIYIQRHISKFLIENNVISYGIVNGRNQIDLYTNDHFNETEYVIEVKLLKGHQSYLSTSKINSFMTQLLSYMDQINQSKGILIIYNLSSDLILVPSEWFKEKVKIIAINQCKDTPSGRSRTVEIVFPEGDKSRIEIIKNKI
jgi:hypothetical protein